MSSSLQFSQQAQNAFIADVTHELRTPLTVIKGSVETLEDGALEDKDGRGGLLSSLGRETDRLIGLVNDLLTLTRADASALRLRIQSLDLAQLVRERVRLLDPLLIQKELKIELDGPAELLDGTLKTAGDPDRLSQVLDNILNNAIRYAPDGSQITIKLKDLDGMIECSVRDQGPGIPQEHLSFIFERFYRVDPSRDRTSGGTGLGLAIARALLEAQGGQISAASREGAWTSISIRLPTF